MRAAHLLRQAQQHAGQQRPQQPPAGSARCTAAQYKPACQIGKGRGRMARRKAMARAPVAHTPKPMRDMARHAAKLGQIPGAAGVVQALEHGDRQGPTGNGQPQLPALARRQAAQKPPGLEHPHQQRQQQRRAGHARQLMRQQHKERLLAQGKALGRARPARQGQIKTRGVPQYQQHEEQQRQRPQAAQGPGRHGKTRQSLQP